MPINQDPHILPNLPLDDLATLMREHPGWFPAPTPPLAEQTLDIQCRQTTPTTTQLDMFGGEAAVPTDDISTAMDAAIRISSITMAITMTFGPRLSYTWTAVATIAAHETTDSGRVTVTMHDLTDETCTPEMVFDDLQALLKHGLLTFLDRTPRPCLGVPDPQTCNEILARAFPQSAPWQEACQRMAQGFTIVDDVAPDTAPDPTPPPDTPPPNKSGSRRATRRRNAARRKRK